MMGAFQSRVCAILCGCHRAPSCQFCGIRLGAGLSLATVLDSDARSPDTGEYESGVTWESDHEFA